MMKEVELEYNDILKKGKELVYPQKQEMWTQYCKENILIAKNALSIMQLLDKNEIDKALKDWKKVLVKSNKKSNAELPIYDIFNVIVMLSKKGPEFYEKVIALYGPSDISQNVPAEVTEYLNNLKSENAKFEKALAEKENNNGVKPKQAGEE